MKNIKIIIIVLLIAVLSFIAGCRLTMLCAVPCGESSIDNQSGYVISYQYFDNFEFNEFYI